ncbi:MAG: hypothetical protein ACRD2U_07110 [Terriglobales bacterium]
MVARSLLLTFFLFATFAAAGEDTQSKAEKEVRKISAMAADMSARPLVSQVIAEFLKTNRSELVQQRQAANLNYGSLFVAYQLTESGKRFDEVIGALKSGKDIWQVGNEMHADWKQVAAEAKKLNAKLESAFYQFFLNQSQKSRHAADGYVAARDQTPADVQGLTEKDVAVAQDTFARCFQRARGGSATAGLPDQKNHESPQMEGDPR